MKRFKKKAMSKLVGRFLEASKTGDHKKIGDCLEKGVDVNIKDTDGKTALHHATKFASLATVKFLVENGADINALDVNSNTALHLASKAEKFDIIKYLVEKGVKVNIKNSDGKTAEYMCRRTNIKTFLHETSYVHKQLSNMSLARLKELRQASTELGKCELKLKEVELEKTKIEDERRSLEDRVSGLRKENLMLLEKIKSLEEKTGDLDKKNKELTKVSNFGPSWENQRKHIDGMINNLKLKNFELMDLKKVKRKVYDLNQKILTSKEGYNPKDAEKLKKMTLQLQGESKKVLRELYTIDKHYKDENLVTLFEFFQNFRSHEKKIENAIVQAQLLEMENDICMRNSLTAERLKEKLCKLHKEFQEKSKERRKFVLKFNYGLEDDALNETQIELGRQRIDQMTEEEMAVKRQLEDCDLMLGELVDCYEIYKLEAKEVSKTLQKVKKEKFFKFLFDHNLLVSRSLADYKNLKLLQKSQGDVYIGELKERSGGQMVVLKVQNFSKGMENRYMEELETLMKLKHPTITRVNAVFTFVSKDSHKRQLAIEMDYHNQDLLHWLKNSDEKLSREELLRKKTRRSIKEIKNMFKQVFDGLCYMHDQGVSHNKLTVENIIVTRDDEIRIIDFLERGKNNQEVRLSSMGRRKTKQFDRYMAPEKKLSCEADIYSCGICLYEMICKNSQDLLDFRGILKLGGVEHEVEKDLITKMCERQPEKRLTARQVLEHDFFTTNYEGEDKVDRQSIRMSSSDEKSVTITIESAKKSDFINPVLDLFVDMKTSHQLLKDIYVVIGENKPERLEDVLPHFVKQFLKSKYIEFVPNTEYPPEEKKVEDEKEKKVKKGGRRSRKKKKKPEKLFLPSAKDDYTQTFERLGKLMMRCLVKTVMLKNLSFHPFFFFVFLSIEPTVKELTPIVRLYDREFMKVLSSIPTVRDINALALSFPDGRQVDDKNKGEYQLFRMKKMMIGEGMYRLQNIKAAKRGFFSCISHERAQEIRKFSPGDLEFFVSGVVRK